MTRQNLFFLKFNDAFYKRNVQFWNLHVRYSTEKLLDWTKWQNFTWYPSLPFMLSCLYLVNVYTYFEHFSGGTYSFSCCRCLFCALNFVNITLSNFMKLSCARDIYGRPKPYSNTSKLLLFLNHKKSGGIVMPGLNEICNCFTTCYIFLCGFITFLFSEHTHTYLWTPGSLVHGFVTFSMSMCIWLKNPLKNP